MTNEERFKKLCKYEEMEEKFRPIFLISLGIFFLVFIIIMLSDKRNVVFLAIMLIPFGVSFGVFMISVIILLISHYSYQNLLNETMRINNVKLTTIIQEPTKNYTTNYVMEGKYKNEKITGGSLLRTASSPFSKRYISSYTVIDETNKDQYSFWKGALGVALFGGFGAVAGIGGKSTKEYLIAIEWKDGEKSLILIDEEYYKVFVASMF